MTQDGTSDPSLRISREWVVRHRAKLRDPELLELCDGIVAGQQQEIDQMKAKLADARR